MVASNSAPGDPPHGLVPVLRPPLSDLAATKANVVNRIRHDTDGFSQQLNEVMQKVASLNVDDYTKLGVAQRLEPAFNWLRQASGTVAQSIDDVTNLNTAIVRAEMDTDLVQPGFVRTIVSKLQPKPGSAEYDNAADDKDLGRSNYQQLKESLATNKNKAIKLADRAVETMKKSAEALMMVRILEAKLAEMEANKTFQKDQDRQIRENKKKEKAIQLENAQFRANKRLRSLSGKAVGRVTVTDPDEALIFDEAEEEDDDAMDI